MIRDISYKGLPIVVPYIPHNSDAVFSFFSSKGVAIPKLSEMGKGNVTWYILTTDFTVIIDHVLYGKIEIDSFVGSQTDWGSVPRMARSFVDNDDPQLLMAFWIHDKLFQTQFFGIDKKAWQSSNELFEDCMRYYKVSQWKRDIIVDGVSSGLGWNAYHKREPRDAPQYQKCLILIKGA